PDSQKLTTEQLGDRLKGTGDSIASTSQNHDAEGRPPNSTHTDESLLTKAKNDVRMGEK
ncbi:hypothetical protein C8R45DRAFT_843827, partial [Mycena sanguinolenta]